MIEQKSEASVEHSFDVCILGAGFGGSLLAWILARQGRRVMLLDRAKHPKFAIGESSTPVGNMTLRRLAADYGMPELLAMSRYGSWKEAYPELGVGCKRGFSYFFHSPFQSFRTDSQHSGELLVAANASDATADTHWIRADVDAWMCQQARQAGAVVREQTEITGLKRDEQWCLQTLSPSDPENPVSLRFQSDFLVDATGAAAATRQWLPIQDMRHTLATNSRALYAHFGDVAKWTSLMQQFGYSVEDHPFDCDDAAQHHVIEEGWLWALRFSHNVTSIGLVLDCNQLSGRSASALPDPADADSLWKTMLRRYPALQAMLFDAHIVAPPAGMQLSARLQSRWRPCAGDGWALLPGTAGFIDPLHSTGIAQTLLGVERLAQRLLSPCSIDAARDWSTTYADTVDAELTMIDQLVHGCYLTRHEPSRFTSFVMLYFAAVTSFEHRAGIGSLSPEQSAFLLATTPEWCKIVSEIYQMTVDHASGRATISPDEFENVVRHRISEFNSAGLCDPSVRRMYRFTVASD